MGEAGLKVYGNSVLLLKLVESGKLFQNKRSFKKEGKLFQNKRLFKKEGRKDQSKDPFLL